MRASFLLVVTVAVLVGLGVAVFLRQSGFFTPPQSALAAQAAAPPPPTLVLVATQPVFKGKSLSPNIVTTRPLRAEEEADYKAHKDKYIPADRNAITLRDATNDIPADRPLKVDDILPIKPPEELAARLIPWSRAVDLQVEINDAAGGQIAIGDWVDVYLTTDVGQTNQTETAKRTALLAKNALVVAKRNTLFPVYAPLTKGEPIPHTLAVNPYRASVLDYARTVGTVSLVPVSKTEQEGLDTAIKNLKKPEDLAGLSHPANSKEYDDEVMKITEFIRGSPVGVGDTDLAQLLKLKPLGGREVLESRTTKVEVLSGAKRLEPLEIAAEPVRVVLEAPRYTFTHPRDAEEMKDKDRKKAIGTPNSPLSPTPRTVLPKSQGVQNPGPAGGPQAADRPAVSPVGR